MAAAVLANRNTGVGAADLHIELGICDGVADLLVSTACTEHGKGGAEGDQSHGRQTGADVGHIGLSNTAVEETLGVSTFEILGHGGTGQISIQNDDLFVDSAQFYQSLAIGFTGCNLFTHGLSPPIPSKPAHAVRRWGLCRASLPDFP